MLRLPIIITLVDLVNLFKLITKKMEWYTGKCFCTKSVVFTFKLFFE